MAAVAPAAVGELRGLQRAALDPQKKDESGQTSVKLNRPCRHDSPVSPFLSSHLWPACPPWSYPSALSGPTQLHAHTTPTAAHLTHFLLLQVAGRPLPPRLTQVRDDACTECAHLCCNLVINAPHDVTSGSLQGDVVLLDDAASAGLQQVRLLACSFRRCPPPLSCRNPNSYFFLLAPGRSSPVDFQPFERRAMHPIYPRNHALSPSPSRHNVRRSFCSCRTRSRRHQLAVHLHRRCHYRSETRR